MPALHYLPVSQDYEHLYIPLVRGELEADKVKMVVASNPPAKGEENIERLETELTDHDIAVERLNVPIENNSNSNVVNESYKEIYTEMKRDVDASDNEVYVNLGRSTPAVTFALLRAVDMLIHESTLIESLEEHPKVPADRNIRDEITLYRTAPEKELYQDVVERYEESWSYFRTTDPFERQGELLGELESLMEKVAEKVEGDGFVEEATEIIEELSFRNSDMERQFDDLNTSMSQPGEDLEKYGFSKGAKELTGGQRYEELPEPLYLQIRTMEWAILYTLVAEGEVDSISDLLDKIIRMTLMLLNGNTEDLLRLRDEDEAADIQASLEEILEHQPEAVMDELRRSIRSKIQYNLDLLEEKGFVEKEKSGRSYAVRLSKAGRLWAEGMEIEEELEAIHQEENEGFWAFIGNPLDQESLPDSLQMVYSDVIDNVARVIEAYDSDQGS